MHAPAGSEPGGLGLQSDSSAAALGRPPVCISIPMFVPSDVPLGPICLISGESLESSGAGICA